MPRLIDFPMGEQSADLQRPRRTAHPAVERALQQVSEFPDTATCDAILKSLADAAKRARRDTE